MKRPLPLSRVGALLWLLQTCMIGACGDDPPPPLVEPEPERVPEAPVVTAAPEAPEPTAEEIPIPEDFEEEAARDITANDLRAQLDTLEQEISAPE